MEKEFVPYEPALELKQIGFDEPCFGKFLTSLQSNWKDYELILELGMNDTFEDNRNIYLLEKACSAPTFSQAFRWFRENHDLFGIVQGKGYNHKRYYIHTINDEWHPSQPTFDIYEEAELACLRKLIEIVKNK